MVGEGSPIPPIHCSSCDGNHLLFTFNLENSETSLQEMNIFTGKWVNIVFESGSTVTLQNYSRLFSYRLVAFLLSLQLEGVWVTA
jgi:hypothetical protein